MTHSLGVEPFTSRTGSIYIHYHYSPGSPGICRSLGQEHISHSLTRHTHTHIQTRSLARSYHTCTFHARAFDVFVRPARLDTQHQPLPNRILRYRVSHDLLVSSHDFLVRSHEELENGSRNLEKNKHFAKQLTQPTLALNSSKLSPTQQDPSALDNTWR